MDNPIKNLFAITDLRNRVLFTLGLLGVYRIGSHIPTPGINQEALQILAQQAGGTMFGLYDMFSGRNLSNMTIFALGVMPYISASIILQLLTVVWSYLERISKEGELGRRKITQYTRYLTLLLAAVQSFGIAIWLERAPNIVGGLLLVCVCGWGLCLIPVIFASSILSFIGMGQTLFETGTWARRAIDQLAYGMPLFNLLTIVGIIFFAYFYTAIIFNPDDVAENMRKYGGFIPGI